MATKGALTFRRGLFVATVALVGGTCWACSGGKAAAPGGDDVVAEMKEATITRADLDKRVADQMRRLQQEEYDLKRRALDDMVEEKLVERAAKARGLSKDDLLRAEVEAKVAATTPSEITAGYELLKARLGGRSRDEAATILAEGLRRPRLEARRIAFARELSQKAEVHIKLVVPRYEVVLPASAPVLGTRDAPVTIVEFSDYQCPYCHHAQSTVDDIVKQYGAKVRLIHGDFPLDNHARAFSASRASRCAGEQGRFWEYHRGLFEGSGDFSDKDFTTRAGLLGLRVPDFTTCLASDRHDAAIRESQEVGSKLGVTGTPTFFINGRMLSGAKPLSEFEEVIDAELAGG